MVFNILTLFPYSGNSKGYRVYKMFLVEDKHQYFLQGYYIEEKNKKKFLVYPKLNDLTDYSVIDTYDTTKWALYEKEGKYKLRVANDLVEGLGKFVEVDINLKVDEPLKKSLSEAVYEFKQELMPLYQESEAVADYIFLSVLTQYKRDFKTIKYTSPKEYLLDKLYSLARSDYFVKMITNNDERFVDLYSVSLSFFQRITPLDIAKIIRTIEVIKDYKLDISELDMFDLKKLYEVALKIPRLALSRLILDLQKSENSFFIFTCTRDKENNKKEAIKALSSIHKINAISLYKNSKIVCNVKLNVPLYSADLINDIQNNGMLYIINPNVEILIDFNRSYLAYSCSENRFETKLSLDNEKLDCKDTNIFKIELKHEE